MHSTFSERKGIPESPHMVLCCSPAPETTGYLFPKTQHFSFADLTSAHVFPLLWNLQIVKRNRPNFLIDLNTVGLLVCACVRVCVYVWCVYVHVSWQLSCNTGEQGYRENQAPQTDRFHSCSPSTRCCNLLFPSFTQVYPSFEAAIKFPLPTPRTQRVRIQWFSLQASVCHTNQCHLPELSLLIVKSFSLWVVVFRYVKNPTFAGLW